MSKSFLNPKIRPIYFVAILLSMSSILTAQESKPEFSMTKGMCFGYCPEYTLEVHKGGRMVYKGYKNTDRIGIYEKKLDKKSYRNLCKAFKKTEFTSYKEHYESRLPDLPLITVRYDKKDKVVSGKENRPDAILALEEKMSFHAENMVGWELIRTWSEIETEKDQYDGNEIIILCRRNFNVDLWSRKYHFYDLKMIKRLSPRMDYYLMQFNPSKITQERMLTTLKNDPDIVDAQFNSEIKPRN